VREHLSQLFQGAGLIALGLYVRGQFHALDWARHSADIALLGGACLLLYAAVMLGIDNAPRSGRRSAWPE
jgi:hypothetical protein